MSAVRVTGRSIYVWLYVSCGSNPDGQFGGMQKLPAYRKRNGQVYEDGLVNRNRHAEQFEKAPATLAVLTATSAELPTDHLSVPDK